MKKMIKRILTLFLVLAMTSVSVNANREGSKSWYIKRNGNDRPSFPDGAEELSGFDCYYIDDKSRERGEKRLYLTFDAGYENGNVEKILDVLAEEKVPAAFFVLDNIILKNTDLVNRMADEGHLVCNHTKNHKNLSFATKEQISADLSALEEIYKEQTGREMSKYFRFPEGKYSNEAIKIIHELGYTTVFWSFCYDDWDNARQMSEEKAKRKILSNTHDGAIILLHPTSRTNARILKDLISEWRSAGYSFASLDELGK